MATAGDELFLYGDASVQRSALLRDERRSSVTRRIGSEAHVHSDLKIRMSVPASLCLLVWSLAAAAQQLLHSAERAHHSGGLVGQEDRLVRVLGDLKQSLQVFLRDQILGRAAGGADGLRDQLNGL